MQLEQVNGAVMVLTAEVRQLKAQLRDQQRASRKARARAPT